MVTWLSDTLVLMSERVYKPIGKTFLFAGRVIWVSKTTTEKNFTASS
ncbi:hypothetical protein FLA_1819 [Filimonas lacunae]|nr:hypothetical protein FLA_1819 [Filimonas lacunae]